MTADAAGATESAAPPALRLTRGIAIAWILANAATPLLQAAGWTALFKEVRPEDPWAPVLPPVLWATAMLALPAVLLLIGGVLRRAAPALGWWQLAPAMLAAALLGLAASVAGLDLRPVQLRFIAAMHPGEAFTWNEFAALPWAALAGRAAALAAVCLLPPAWVFARAARVPWTQVVIAVVVAGAASALLSPLWQLAGIRFESLDQAVMTGWDGRRRAIALVAQAGAHAVWAAVSAMVLAWQLRAGEGPQRHAWTHLFAGTALALALVTPAAASLLERGGLEGAWTSFRRAWSLAPAEDVSEGERLLKYDFTAPVTLRETPSSVSLSPDGRWIVAVDGQRHVVVLDTATHALAHRSPEPLEPYESPAWSWSPDARWLAIRTHGEVLPGRYPRHQARLRIYAAPRFEQAGEYRHGGAECLSDHFSESPVMFNREGTALWLACLQQGRPARGDLVALRLGVPDLRVQAERRYEEISPWPLRGLRQVGDATWSWHAGDREAPHVRLRDLDGDRVPVALQAPPARPGDPEWLLQEARFEQGRLTVRLAAWTQGRMLFLAYDLASGALVSRKEEPAGTSVEPMVASWPLANGLRIEGRWRHASRAGELRVVDATTGAVHQRIRTVAQRPVAASDDGRWLATQSVDGGELRVYRLDAAGGNVPR